MPLSLLYLGIYDPASGQPAVITDAVGNTACYRYDARGRKIAEWGTGIQIPRRLVGGLDKPRSGFAPKGRATNGVVARQPACFEYDEDDRMTALTTFRADGGDITTDPSSRTDGDTTTWDYHDATGLETRKTYADGSHVDKAYDEYNRLQVETLARGITKTHSYEPDRGLLLGTTYSDGTTARAYQYNHLGQLVQVTDDAGTRTIGYNHYGEQETDSLITAEGVTHLITENRDAYGRSTGYMYSKDGVTQQTTVTSYSPEGRIATAGFLHNGEEQHFTYGYLPGSGLLQTLAMPNGVTLAQAYEARRNLLTEMAYQKDGVTLASRSYRYDNLERPTARDIQRDGARRKDQFGYNTRSELVDAQLGLEAYRYSYDNIGNRKQTQGETEAVYTSNALNQYTRIGSADGATCFAPAYDADGNQTLVKTSTGVWHVEYNAENRPVAFTRTEGNVTTHVSCTYDSMGRRATKKVETNGETTLHQRYLYRGYLQIAACDLTTEGTPTLWHILWDPTQSVATRPLAIQKDGTWYTYGWDLTKNVCELINSEGAVATTYNYSPYGEVTTDGNITQPIQWSGEFNDAELGMESYNYRYYNSQEGRWLRRDPYEGSYNLYAYVANDTIRSIDLLGLVVLMSCARFPSGSMVCTLYIVNGLCECERCRKKAGSLFKASSTEKLIENANELWDCARRYQLENPDTSITIDEISPIYTNYGVNDLKDHPPIPDNTLYRILPKLDGEGEDKKVGKGMSYHKGTPSPTDLNKSNSPGTLHDNNKNRNRNKIRIHALGKSEGCITVGSSVIEPDGTSETLVSPTEGEGFLEKLMAEHNECGGMYLLITNFSAEYEPEELIQLRNDYKNGNIRAIPAIRKQNIYL